MPKPVYILMAQSVIEDSVSKLVSLISLIEALNLPVDATGAPTDGVPGKEAASLVNSLTVLAVWRKESGDESDSFETRFLIQMPDGSSEECSDWFPVTFSKEPNKTTVRLKLGLPGIPVAKSPGVAQMTSEMRRSSDGKLISQSFSFDIRHIEVQKADEPANQTAKP